uniref:GntR family transcriptional regulator n=1 Tax=Ndongobacter massiliensis TaxID=1871025 RepID=UPI000930E0AA|nr:GntR family transcriptional regulator [Ndongobacter massiliensis]
MKKIIKNSLSDQVRHSLEDFFYKKYKDEEYKLPSEIEISESLDISRTTIRKILAEFESMGVIIRIHGKGTFINPEAMQIKTNLNPGMEFSKLIEKNGKVATIKLLSFKVILPDEDIQKELQIGEFEKLYEIIKIYYANHLPAIVSRDCIPCNLFSEEITSADLRDLDKGKSVFSLLLEKSQELVTRDRIKIESIKEKDSRVYTDNKKIFNNSTVLFFTSINFGESNMPIAYINEIYDTRLIKFQLMRVKDITKIL